jgi:lambda family phage tail tape measure protein
MAVIGSLSVKLGLVTVEWDKATAKAKQEAKDLQSAFSKLGVDTNNLKQLFLNLGGAAGLSVAGITAMGAAILDMAGKMQDLSDATGVSNGKILQFQNALMLAGGKAEDAQTIIGTLFSKIAAAQDGNDTAIAQFEQLGISFAELKRLSPDEAIKRVYEGLSQVGNSYEKVKNIKELLGKAGLGKSVDDIAKALQGSTKEFDRQAEALKKWDAMGDALTQTMFNLKVAFAELLAPFTTTKVATVDQFKSAIIAIGSAVVVGQIMNLVAAFKALNTALKGTAALSAALGALKGGKGLAMSAAALAAYTTAMSVYGKDEEEENTGGATATWDENQPAVQGKDMGGKEGGNAAAQQRARLDMMRDQLSFAKKRNELQIQFLSGSQWELRYAESALQRDEEINRAKHERNQAAAKENMTAEQRGLVEEEYKVKVAKANSEFSSRNAMIDGQRDKTLKLMMLETDQLQVRNNFAKNSLALETQRRDMTDGEYQRNRAQLQMEQRVLDIRQEQARFELENKDIDKSNFQIVESRTRAREREKALVEEYKTQVEIINREEQIRRDLIRQDLEVMQKRNDLNLKAAQLANDSRYMTEFEVRAAQSQIELSQRLLDIEAQRQALRTSRTDTMSEEYQAELQRLALLEDMARKEADIRQQGIRLDENEAMTWLGGWEKAFRDYAKAAQEYGRMGAEAFNSVVGNMNAAIDNFVRTGKLSFKDLARSIIQDLIAIQLKAQAAFLLKAALGAMGFGGLTGKAGGGMVSQGLPYMVGENGPELFVPDTGGSIVPTGRMGDSAANSGQTVNYNGPYIANMNAIDTQSATQFLVRNRQAVWTANQSASRSLPISR